MLRYSPPSWHAGVRRTRCPFRLGEVEVPSGTTLANALPLYSDLAVGGQTGYISFQSQTVTLVITPTGSVATKYTSTALALTGGEVRTVVIMDSQLTSNPPVSVLIADDVN